jgi:hypothetical protein
VVQFNGINVQDLLKKLVLFIGILVLSMNIKSKNLKSEKKYIF